MAVRVDAAIALLGASLVAGCGESEAATAATSGSSPPDAGMPAEGCAAGELRDGDRCRPAGVEVCGDGFVSDGEGGCSPVLPAEPCAAGTMAVPGEESCRAVMRCAAGRWAEIPIDADTQFVDATYAEIDSDGSADRPWRTIGDAVAMAEPDAVVAIAAGSYAEDVVVEPGRPVRLWGVCPEMVEIVGAENAISVAASGTEVRDLSVRSTAVGIGVWGASAVVIDRVRVHDTGQPGVVAVADAEPAEISISRSLIEDTRDLGMFVWGAAATVDRSVIREVERLQDSQFGYAIDLESRDVHRGMLLLRGSLVERAQTIGIYAAAADVTIESTVVRYMQPGPLSFHGGGGRALSVQDSKDGSARGRGLVDRSVFQHNQEFGIFVIGSDLEVTSTVIEDTMPQEADQRIGRGISVVTDVVTHVLSTAIIRSSMIRRNHQIGVFLETSEATVESTVIRDTLPDASTGLWGAGLGVQLDVAKQKSTASVRGCVIADAHQVGISIIGVEATVDSTSVSRTKPEEASGNFGDGIVVSSFYGSPATATITGSRIEGSARAGLAVFGSSASVSTTTLECQAIHLDAEHYQSLAPEVHDLGGNVCGCAGESVTCQAVSSSLAPPKPLDAPF